MRRRLLRCWGEWVEPSAAGAGRVLHNSILWPRAASTGVIRRDAPGRLPAGTPSTRPRTRTARENILVFNAGLGSTSSPAPAVRSPRPPNSCPLCARSPSGTMSKGRDATTITDSTGRRRITKLWDRGSRRALRAPSRGAGRHAAPSSGLRRRDGVLVVRSCARPRGAQAVATAAPSPRVGAASCRGVGPTVRALGCRVFSARRLDGGRAVAPHERPARMRERRAPEGPLHAIDAT